MPMEQMEDMIPALKILPFPKILNFDRSGAAVTQTLYPWSRKAFMECPACKSWGDIYEPHRNLNMFSMAFCKGNQPIELECAEGGHPHIMPCGGILEPHFHIKCVVCDYILLLRMPGV
jgi:hypothetical protein